MSADIPAKLLIVDDLRENLVALEALIRQGDRQIHQASSGEQALALMLEHEFAIAILDVQMPGMNGFELAELMRGTEKTRRIPIIFVSAGGREMNYAFAGYESGAIDFLYKPLDAHAVRSKVSAFVEMYRQRKQQESLLAELRATRDELEHAIRMRDDFVSMVSHELRTPLNTLFLQTQLRRRMAGGAPISVEKVQAMVERDEQQIRNMVRLIDDMLDLSRLRRGTLAIAPEATDVARLVRQTAESFSGQMSAVGCVLEVTAPDSLPAVLDEFRIEQVVANLLTNAMRYGAGKPVHVSVEAVSEGVKIVVLDGGRGIAPQDLDRIFGQFERAVDKRAVPGLGLGLFISRQIVDAHGGSISVSSVVGEGSAFTVTLPLEPRNI